MSIRLVACPHPFRTDRLILETEPKSLSELFAELHSPLPIERARFMIGDRVTTDISEVPPDGSIVIIKVVPAGADNATQRTGKGEFWAGLGLAVLGVILLPAGIGASLVGAGVSMMLSGVILYNTDMPKAPGASQPDPSLHGSRNRHDPDGPVLLLLGRHLLAPDHAAVPFTSISDDKQYLHQLFCVGYSDVAVEADSFKIGDTPIGKYSEVSPVEILSAGEQSAYYPVVCKEVSIGRTLKHTGEAGGSGAIVQRTMADARKIGIDIAFPRGLVKYNSDGDKQSRSVDIRAYYKKWSEPDTAYQLMGTWNGSGSTVVSAATTKTLRRVIEKVLDNAGPEGADYCPERQYDVKLDRVTADFSDSDIVDEVAWGSLRSFRADRPVDPAWQPKLCLIGVKIRASEQLSGIIDQFNLVAQTRVRDYSGSGSGPAAWTPALTSNPASLYLYLLTGQPNPQPVTDDRIDWPALEAWHTWCAEHGYECNAVLSSDQPRDQILAGIAACGRALPAKIDGIHTVILDAERPTPVQLITPRNSWGFSACKAFPDQPHALKVAFKNASLGWQDDERIVYDSGYNADGSGGLLAATKFQSVDGWGITAADLAHLKGRYLLACSRLRPESFSLYMDFEYTPCTRGDRVLFSHDVLLVGLARGLLKALTTGEGGAVTAIEVDQVLIMEDGKTYGLTIRKTDESFLSCRLLTEPGTHTTVIPEEPILAADAPAAGDLFAFGEWGLITEDCIISGIEPGEDHSAKLALVAYAPEIFGIDDPAYVIPPHNPKISLQGDLSGPPQITTLYDPAAAVRDLTERAASSAANIVVRPTYEQLQGGYTAGGGVEVPAVPVIQAMPAGKRANRIWADLQANLTNFGRLEFQVTRNQVSWYSIPTAAPIIDWKGVLDGLTVAVPDGAQVIQACIPPDGTAAAPVAYPLYYRARRVTKANVVSGWSAVVEATFSLVETGDYAARSLYVDAFIGNQMRALVARLGKIIAEDIEVTSVQEIDPDALLASEVQFPQDAEAAWMCRDGRGVAGAIHHWHLDGSLADAVGSDTLTGTPTYEAGKAGQAAKRR